MNVIYRAWWRALSDLRPTVRFLAERFPKLAPWGIRLRWLAHVFVGNPIQALVVFDAFFLWRNHGWPGPIVLTALLVLCLMVEIGHRAGYCHGNRFVGWREACRFRRKWPSEWAQVAAKTTRVQAEVGTSKEPIASAVLRPVADHPKLSWWPRVEWPVISWWVGPPPGRSLAALDELATVLAANLSRATDVHVEFEREGDSHGRLVVLFDDVLAEPSSPAWAKPHPVGPDDQGDDDLAAALKRFDHEQAASRPDLWVIDGEGPA